mgnify:CR=1 FL=1
MFGIGSLQASERYGAIVDIGSGSVLAAIVASHPDRAYPTVVWSKREHTPLRANASTTDAAHNVMSSFMNVLMALDSAGRQALAAHDRTARLSHLQVTVAAPWSYTITKTITHAREETFPVTTDLISELVNRAREQTREELQENELSNRLGLTVTARMITHITANDYELESIAGQPVSSVALSHSSVITQTYLTDAITDAHDKMFRRAKLDTYSFMLVFYCALRDLHPHLREYCLIDVTYEATEIAIIRDGILRYCTHTPFGAYSIAREISAITDLPLAEAYGHLTGPDLATLRERCNDEQNEEISTMFTKYEQRLAELLTETGDELSLPRQLFVHSTLTTEPFFRERLEHASSSVTGNTHLVTTATLPIVTAHMPEGAVAAAKKLGGDSALIVAAQFFHQCHHCEKVSYPRNL